MGQLISTSVSKLQDILGGAYGRGKEVVFSQEAQSLYRRHYFYMANDSDYRALFRRGGERYELVLFLYECVNGFLLRADEKSESFILKRARKRQWIESQEGHTVYFYGYAHRKAVVGYEFCKQWAIVGGEDFDDAIFVRDWRHYAGEPKSGMKWVRGEKLKDQAFSHMP